MCKLCAEMFESWKNPEMHSRVKGFFKQVTEHGTPERLAAQTERQKAPRWLLNTEPIALLRTRRFAQLF